ncbi:MAG: hypothetical protein IPF83_05050 [Rhodanobacteraceae bacterium]|nr:hypothetical protein [Rhodanobacteraceae bacterium]
MERKELFEILKVRGADALPFLHGQFAADLMPLADGQLRWSALLNPQGRVMSLVVAASQIRQRLVATGPLPRGNELADTLRRLVFRRKVRIELDASVGVAPGNRPRHRHRRAYCAVVDQGATIVLTIKMHWIGSSAPA